MLARKYTEQAEVSMENNEYVKWFECNPISELEWKKLLQEETWAVIEKTLFELQTKNRYFPDPAILKLIYAYATRKDCIPNTNGCLKIGTKLYRARIYDEDDAKDRYEKHDMDQFQGYDKKNSGVSDKPTENRCSPEGIAYLYVAEDEETAISEVLSSANEYVSVATIKLLRNVKIFNLGIIASSGCEGGDVKGRRLNSFLMDLANYFKQPVSDNQKKSYLLCQYVSEFVKMLGFDGIAFYSSKMLRNKINYTIFNHEDCCDVISSELRHIDMRYYNFLRI